MKGKLPQLGLVCQTLSEQVRFRTITLSRYRPMKRAEQRATLAAIYRDNLSRLCAALGFCRLHDLHLYRMPSGLFPMSDEQPGDSLVRDMADELAIVGQLATMWDIRIVMHPDQFVVLNSTKPQVIEQSMSILGKQALWMDLMMLPRSTWSAMNIHGGAAGRGAELVANIRRLDDAVRSRLTLENDEWSYGAPEIVAICREAGVPMIFDAHHHLVKERLRSYDDASVDAMMHAAAATWPQQDWAIVHISNGMESLHDRRHSEVIRRFPKAFRSAPWIEVEAKAKEVAIEELRQLMHKRNRR